MFSSSGSGHAVQALADPRCLASWYGHAEGDLRLGGQFRLLVEDADPDATGRVEACEPPRQLQLRTRENEESYRCEQGCRRTTRH